MKLSLILLSVVASAFAGTAHQNVKRDHHARAAAAAVHQRNATELDKRQDEAFHGRATYYDVTPNAGACGDWMQNSWPVVALNTPQLQAYGGYQNGKPTSCGRWVTIQAQGKQFNAEIKDECPPCGWGSLDLSAGLFQQFAHHDMGVFEITWWFADGPGPQPPAPATPEWTPPPQDTYTPPPPPPSTTETTSTTTQQTTTAPTTTATSSSSDDNSIQEVTTSTQPHNIDNINLAAVKMAAFINAAAGL